MTTYNKIEAAEKAIELTSKALSAGWFTPAQPHGHLNPANTGKQGAEFLGAFIKQLAKELESL
ncbi:hypothetical protein [Burkholderia gladioli]|uniref:hypothetical protein n=1 Tax=Burkholderia gladioli TaxID=28095 RepID=UPI00164037F4|nr:hypothetical protein [Burkholderia gladioli]MBU9385111.1 hypothetical protein [Burkholderia gladioli]